MSVEHVVSRPSTPIKVESTPLPETMSDVVKRKEDAAGKGIASKYFTSKKEEEKPLNSEVNDRCLKAEDDGATKEERASVERNAQPTFSRRMRNVPAGYRTAAAAVIDLMSEDEQFNSATGASAETAEQSRAHSAAGERKTGPIPDMSRRTSGRVRRAVQKVDHDSDDFEDSPEPVNERRRSKKQRLKRGYAPPEVYAHLNYVQDNLDYDLNTQGKNLPEKGITLPILVMASGSAFTKVPYAGLTDTLIPPSEDHTLPERFRLGITNLVDRPSAEMNELSMAERRAAVPGFLRKVHKWRPKIVCMIGKGIWEDVFAYATKASKGNCVEDGIRVERHTAGSSGQKDLPKLKDVFEYDIQPICLLHGLNKDTKTKRTLFFVVPSTSGRVLTHQLSDKVLLFQLLRKRWEELEAGRMTKSVEWEIRIDGTT